MQLDDAVQQNSNNPEKAGRLNANINAKRQMLIEDTENLIGQLGGDITSAEYNNFGWQLVRDGRLPEGIKYYNSARQNATTWFAESQADRSLALTWMTRGTNFNADSGRTYWAQALAVLDKRNDQSPLFLSAQDLRLWASEEWDLGNYAKADSLTEKALEKDVLLARWRKTDTPSVATTAVKQ